MDIESKGKLKLVFADILRGYSIAYPEKYGEIFIKHLTNLDSADIDLKQEFFYQKAIKRNLPNLMQQEEYILKEGLWDKKQDKEISDLKMFLEGLKRAKSKSVLKNDQEKINKQISENEEKLKFLEYQKSELIGFTAESYASKRVNEYYMYNALYKDSELKHRFFGEAEFDDLDSESVDKLITFYNDATKNFFEKNLKRIAISPFFLNFFYLCNDNPFTFYGKAVVHLTFYQAELFGYGRYFKQVFSDAKNKPPEEYMNDPDKLIEWSEASKNAEKILEKSQGKENVAVSIVGATKEDYKRLGLDNPNETIDLAKEAAKKGGSLSMQDLMRLHGN